MRLTKISPIGLTDKDLAIASVVKTLVDLPNIQLEVVAPDDQTGEIVLINADSKEGADYLESNQDKVIKIAFSSTPFTKEGMRILQRPVRAQDLVDTLNLACKYLASATPDTGNTADATDGAATTPGTPSNNTPFLLDTINKARKEKQLLKIECPPYKSIYVNGANGSIYSNASLPEIYVIAKETNNPPVTEHISEKNFNAETNNTNGYPISTIIWHISLAGSNGKILPGHTVTTPIKLVAIPKFPREYMRKHPGFLKLSAMLVRTPMTVTQLHDATGVEQLLIIDFYNLVYSLGLGTVVQQANSAELYKDMNFERKTLFSKLTDRLRIGE